MSRASSPRDWPDVAFFGLLEIMAFVMLFLSPLLAMTSVRLVWLSIASLRILVLGLALLPSRSVSSGPTRGLSLVGALGFLGRGCLYQIPFWMSAIFFPLSVRQTESALLALTVQGGGCLVVVLLSRWRAFSAESLAYLVSAAWVFLGSTSVVPILWWLGGLGFLFTLRGPWSRRNWGWELRTTHCLAVGLAWLAVFPLRLLCPAVAERTFAPVLFWLLLACLGAVLLLAQQEVVGGGEEAEVSAPQAFSARDWRIGRRSAVVALGWLSLLFLQVTNLTEILAVLALGIAWRRGVHVAALSRDSRERMAWWAASEALLLWFVCRASWPETGLWLAVSLLLLALDGHRREAREVEFWSVALGRAPIDSVLRHGLNLSAPEGFATRVLAESAPAELDQQLTSSAPSGFRERLLERLRQNEDAADA